MKVMLIFPPHWCPVHPYLATPMLKSILQSNGHQVVQKDAAAEAFHYLMKQDRLLGVLSRVRTDFERLEEQQRLTEIERSRYMKLAPIALDPHFSYLEDIDAAISILRDTDMFYDSDRLEWAWKIIYHCFELVSTAFCPTDISPFDFDMPQYTKSVADTLAATYDQNANPYLPYFEDVLLPDITMEAPNLAGISLTTRQQLIPGLTLARLVRSALPYCHVTLGGNMVTRIVDVFEKCPELFDLVSSLIVFEGEYPLLKLTECLENDRPLSEVPNLVFRTGNRVIRNPISTPLSLDSQPAPDFDGLPFHLYLSPDFVIPIMSARGCSWQRCVFCAEHYGTSIRSKDRDAGTLVDHMIQLSQKYHSPYFMFSNVFVTPQSLDRISKILIAKELPFRWFAKAKFSPTLTSDILKRAYKAGCLMLNYGLESASSKVLRAMDKGINLKTALKVLEDTEDAGIWSHVYFLFHFPGETETEAWQTTNFVLNYADLVHSANFNFLRIEKNSPLYLQLQEYLPELQFHIDPSGKDFTVHLDIPEQMYTRQEWQTYSKIVNILKRRYPLWYRVNVKNHFFLYLCKYGKPGLLALERGVRMQRLEQEKVIHQDATLVSCILLLREEVFYSKLRHDIFSSCEESGMQEELRQSSDKDGRLALFSHTYGLEVEQLYSLFPINELAKDVLELISRRCNLSQVANYLAEALHIERNRAWAIALSFVRDLIERHLVECTIPK